MNHKQVEIAKKSQQVAVRIEAGGHDNTAIAGRHFFEQDEIISKVGDGVLGWTFWLIFVFWFVFCIDIPAVHRCVERNVPQ